MSLRNPMRVSVLAAALGAAALFGSVSMTRADVVAHWSFDALVNGVYPDSSPKGDHPAKPESKSQVTQFAGAAPFGNAVALNGKAGSWLNIPPVDFLKGSFTVSVWFSSAVSARNPIFADWASPNFSYQFGLEPVNDPTGNKAVGMWGEFRSPEILPAEITSRKNRRLTSIIKYQETKPAPLNAWHHAAWSYTRTDASHGSLTVYLDGELVGQQDQMTRPNIPVDVYVSNQTARIGYREFDKRTGEIFSGAIDELWVFNTALPAEQVKSLMKTNDIAGGSNIASAANTGNQVAVVTPQDTGPVVVQPPPPNNGNPVVVPSVVDTHQNNPPPPTPSVVDTTHPPEIVKPEVVAPPSVVRPVDAAPVIPAPLAVASSHGYSPTRLAGIGTSSLVALVLASYLVWAFSERSKLASRR